MADYFTFGEFDSRNYNMWLHETGNGRLRQLAPPKVNVTDRPIGTSGDILFDQYYGAKNIPINVFLESRNNDELDGIMIQEISSFLSGLREKELVLSYEPYKYHLATFENQLTATEYARGLIFEQLNFVALSPFGFSVFTTEQIENGLYYDSYFYYGSGLLYYEDMYPYLYSSITSGDEIVIYNGGNTNNALPVFQFTGSATTLTVTKYTDDTYTEIEKIPNTNTDAVFSYGAFSGSLDIDCDYENVYLDGVMANNTFEGDFIPLKGLTAPSFNNLGTIEGVSGNIITLGDYASAVDDYYNGMVIYTLDNRSCFSERREIIDYNGTTKEATLDSAFNNLKIGQDYSIYTLKDGLNYFKVTGTGFSNLNLLVNFRYVYL